MERKTKGKIMGGEHHISFHKIGAPCKWIHNYHGNDRVITMSDFDLAIWTKIKDNVLKFMKDIIDKNPQNDKLDDYIKQVEKFQSPEDIELYWGCRDDSSIVGYMLHDISKIFILSFPGKICGYFDRCSIYDEFEDEGFNNCTALYWCYNDIPIFKLYKMSDEIKELLERPSVEMLIRLKYEIEIYRKLLDERISCVSLDKLENLVSQIKSQGKIINRLSKYPGIFKI